jgi:hypothetical protein
MAWSGSTQGRSPRWQRPDGRPGGIPAVEASMIATATRLVVGAWCDLVTAPGGALAVAIVEAVLVELPLAALSPYIAPHARWSLPRGLTTARAGV